MKKKLRIGTIVVALIALLAIIFIYLYSTSEPVKEENIPSQENVLSTENIQDILLTTVATDKGVAKENLMICFFEQTENDNIYAVGMVSRVGGELVFFYDATSHEITHREVDNATTTDEEFSAFSIVIGTVTPWSGSHIVPCGFNKQDNNEYVFKYYDNYYGYIPDWSFGFATVYLDNESIEWGIHTM